VRVEKRDNRPISVKVYERQDIRVSCQKPGFRADRESQPGQDLFTVELPVRNRAAANQGTQHTIYQCNRKLTHDDRIDAAPE
jgi:hypothetical protein